MRFPDFNDEWQETTLGEIGDIRMCKRIFADQTNTESGVPFYKIGTIGKTVDCYISLSLFEEYTKKYPYPRKGQILVTCAGTIGRCLIFDGVPSYFQDSNIVWIDNNQSVIANSFLFHILDNTNWSRLNTSTITRLYNDDLRNVSLALPSLVEQKKIADFLSLIDERITNLSETIAQMKSLRYGFYNTISHRRKQEWQSSFLRDILTERKENNAMLHEVYSVSVSRGIVNQIEHLGRSFASKDTSHYNTVHFGDIVYTKSPTGKFPYGIVKQSQVKSMVAVSPLYGVYIPDNYHIGAIINSFFESAIRTSNYLAPLIQKGAKNTMNITTQHFLDNKILLPTSLEEQKKIADFLSLVDERIEVEEQLLQQYEKQKRYLLKQMFV